MKRKYLALALALLIMAATLTTALAEGENSGENGGADPLIDSIIIDTAGVYEGMNMSYDSGYKPDIKGDKVEIILPLIINPSSGIQALSGNQLKVVPNLGLATNTPFIFDGVHQQAFILNGSPIGDKTFFLLKLPIKLKSQRSGGEYDISLAVNYSPEGDKGSTTQYITFTVPVTAKGTEATTTPTDNGETEPLPTDTGYSGDSGGDYGGSSEGTGYTGGDGGSGTTSTPRLMLAEFSLSSDPLVAGEEFEISVTLKNTSTKAAIKNMIITFNGETADIITAEKTNSLFLDSIKANGEAKVSMRMKVRLDAEPKPQKIGINIAGEDNSGTAVTEDLAVLVDIKQPTRLEYDDPKMQEEANAGDTIPLTINLFNKGKGKLSNVMVKLSAPGLFPEGSAFVGNMESGSSQVAELSVFVGTLDMPAEGDEDSIDDTGGGEGEDIDWLKTADPYVTGEQDTSGEPLPSAVPLSLGELDTSGEPFQSSEADAPQVTAAGTEATEGTNSEDSIKSAVSVAQEDSDSMDMGGVEGDVKLLETADPYVSGEDAAGMETAGGALGDDLGAAGQNDMMYGPTYGTLVITYEDEFGEEYSEVLDISTTILEPQVMQAEPEMEEPEPEKAGQWWVSVLIAAGVIAAIAIALLILNRRKKNRITLEDDDI